MKNIVKENTTTVASEESFRYGEFCLQCNLTNFACNLSNFYLCEGGSIFGIKILIHKVVENGSNLDPDPQH